MNDLSGKSFHTEVQSGGTPTAESRRHGKNRTTIGQSILGGGHPGVGTDNIINSVSTNGIPVNSNGAVIPFSTAPIGSLSNEAENGPGSGNKGLKATAVWICTPATGSKEKEEEEDDVSEEFVKNFNEHIGNKKNEEKAKRLIEKMRKLGGLSPDTTDKIVQINVPAARNGFCILAGLQNNKHKMEALENLIHLLERDEVTKESAESLVSLAIKLTNKMDRELIQTDTLDVQIKIANAYGVVAELIQRHYGKKHINAITKELKSQFRNTADNCKALNRLEDTHLAYAVSYALEGIKRIRDDNRELLELLERFTHFTTSLANLYNEDLQGFYQELFTTFKDLNNRHEYAWYNGVLIMNDFAKEAFKNPDKLTGIQVLVREKNTDFNWKFLYAAMDTFTKITIHGQTPEIRKQAFEGQKTSTRELPGLLSFKNFHGFIRSPDLSPIVHFGLPKLDDDNGIIRLACIENLLKISKKSPDSLIRFKAKQILIQRLHIESSQGIKELIKKSIPTSAAEQKEWLEETGKFHPDVIAAKDKTDVNTTHFQVEKLSQLAMKAFEKNYKQQKLSSKEREFPKSMPNLPINLIPKEKKSLDEPFLPSPRGPNKIVRQLADCLGTTPEAISGNITFKGDIRPIGNDGLFISEKGMHQITDLILTNKEITNLNFDICKETLKGILVLARILPETKVVKLSLAVKVDSTEAGALADALAARPELTIKFNQASGYYQLGKALAKKGLIEEAIAYFTKGLDDPFDKDVDSTHHKLLLHRGKTYMLNGSPSQAAADFRKILEIDSGNFHAQLELSKANCDLRRYPEAIAAARNAVAIYPEDTKALYQLALSLTGGSHHNDTDVEAAKILKTLTVRDPDNHDVLKLLKELEKRAAKN